MSLFYVGCILGDESGRVLLGNLHNGELQVTEVRRFSFGPIVERNSVHWNIPHVYQELLEALHAVAACEEPIQSVSCTSPAGDYLTFGDHGALLTPVIHHSDGAAQAVRKKLYPRIPWELIYEETGTLDLGPNMFLQLGAEPTRRLKRARHILPIADGLNFLLGGEARMETSMASATGLYNPTLKQWSAQVLEALKVPSNRFPPVVMAGTVLGKLREELSKETGLDDARVIASCSQEMAAVLSGLPVAEDETWAFLSAGKTTVLGTQVAQPIINDVSRQLNFTNQMAYGGSVCFYKRSTGLEILEECQRFWEEKDRSIDYDLLSHLAGSSTPFESLIDPSDRRFATPGEMPLKIQAFCKETHQPVPRKPGPIYRCVLESLALHYRKLVYELEHLIGSEIQRVYFQSTGADTLLKHFTANALQIPVNAITGDTAGIGNLVVQALALGHLHSTQQAREAMKRACKVEAIVPHARIWEQAYDRFVGLSPGVMVAA